MSRHKTPQLGDRTPSQRPRRIGELIQRELAAPLQRRATDHHLGMVTVTAVDVAPDLKNAKVFITQMGAAVAHAQVLSVLGEYLSELRTHIARQLVTRSVPRLSLHYDESIERGARISELLKAPSSTQS